ncbi:helix-turn-helix domain-containing protein, partial [Escherichia fergusonii]
SLTLIASELLMSPSLLKKKLQAEQTTYSQLLTECRMQQALKLLRCDDYAVKKTAILCGYKSVSYFIAVFRKHFGITPTEYQDKRQHHHDLNATKRVMTLPGNRAINDTLSSRWC